MKIRINDTVLIIAGKDKGKTGTVTRLDKKNGRIVVQGANKKIRHIKKTQTRPGEKITFEAPMAISNVKLLCPVSKKATRVGYVTTGKVKQRLCKKSGEVIDTKPTKSKSKK